jgi:dUTP pyrophosphatase
MNYEKVKIQLANPWIPVPKYASELAAGFDLVADETVTFQKQFETHTVKTGLFMAIPEGFELQIRPRSGMSFKTMMIIPNSPGTVDADYRGEIMVILRNLSPEPYTIALGDRIAQAVLAPVWQAEFEVVDHLPETKRGAGGFGSTGK